MKNKVKRQEVRKRGGTAALLGRNKPQNEKKGKQNPSAVNAKHEVAEINECLYDSDSQGTRAAIQQSEILGLYSGPRRFHFFMYSSNIY